jgi:2-haloacid dehalogenase
MSALPEVKALVFDVFGTVVDWRGGIARDARTFLARHGRGDIDPHRFADAWRKRYQPAMEEVRSGRRPFTRLDVLHRENLDGVLKDFGVSTSGVSAEELDWLNRAWHRLDPWPDVVPGLQRLKTRYTLCTLSNGNIGLLTNMAKRAGLPWDCILSAEVFRAYKPDPATYLGVAQVFDVAPEEVMLCAAHQDDLDAARACGLQTAYLERPLEFGALNPKDVSPVPRNDVHARDMEHLAELLGS